VSLPVEKGAKLIAEDILKEAAARAETIVCSAKKEAQTILDAARFSARESEELEIKKAKDEGKQEHDQMLAEGKMKIKREMLKKREDLINDVLREAEGSLKKYVSSKEYGTKLVQMATEACKKLGSNQAVIQVNRRDLKTLEKEREKITRQMGCSPTFGEPIQTIGGLKATTPDGKIVIDETFESRMRREFEPMRIKIAKILFEGSK
jgi:V/A-type H+-transporting ATPase subunit E